jgi:hypothetical protein
MRAVTGKLLEITAKLKSAAIISLIREIVNKKNPSVSFREKN